jgi:hypothetical protein
MSGRSEPSCRSTHISATSRYLSWRSTANYAAATLASSGSMTRRRAAMRWIARPFARGRPAGRAVRADRAGAHGGRRVLQADRPEARPVSVRGSRRRTTHPCTSRAYCWVVSPRAPGDRPSSGCTRCAAPRHLMLCLAPLASQRAVTHSVRSSAPFTAVDRGRRRKAVSTTSLFCTELRSRRQ